MTATDIPARLAGPVTPMPALPPPRMTTSNFSLFIELTSVLELSLMQSGHANGAACDPLRGWNGWCYRVVTVEVMEPTTLVAISNCAARLVMLWRFAIHPKSVQTAQTSPLSSWVSSNRTGQSRPAFGLEVMNWVPSGGLPNTNSVEGRSSMPASAASLDWSISEKNLMPLLAISALMRLIASAIGTALLTRTIPSSLSARAAEATETTRNSISSDMPKLAKRWVKRRVMERLLLLGRMPSAWLPVQDDRWN